MKCRAQKVMVVQRKSDDLFYAGQKGSSAPNWVENIEDANFVAPSKIKSLICAVWGRDEDDYRTFEVVPKLKGGDA